MGADHVDSGQTQQIRVVPAREERGANGQERHHDEQGH